jgi:hypothetical protein
MLLGGHFANVQARISDGEYRTGGLRNATLGYFSLGMTLCLSLPLGE